MNYFALSCFVVPASIAAIAAGSAGPAAGVAIAYLSISELRALQGAYTAIVTGWVIGRTITLYF